MYSICHHVRVKLHFFFFYSHRWLLVHCFFFIIFISVVCLIFCLVYVNINFYLSSSRQPPVSESHWKGLLQDILEMQQNVFKCLSADVCYEVIQTNKAVLVVVP